MLLVLNKTFSILFKSINWNI